MGKPGSRSDLAAKADRKFEKKLQFYAKVRDTVASLGAKSAIGKKKKLRSRQKKLTVYDLSALSELLPEAETKQLRLPTEFKLSYRSRGKLILKEGKQMSTILNHLAFQSNPLASIQQHLESTQPVLDELQDATAAHVARLSGEEQSILLLREYTTCRSKLMLLEYDQSQ